MTDSPNTTNPRGFPLGATLAERRNPCAGEPDKAATFGNIDLPVRAGRSPP
jgi:hypothetical protein